MVQNTPGLHFEVEKQKSGWIVEIYNYRRLIRTIDGFKTKTNAQATAAALTSVYRAGIIEGQFTNVGIESPRQAEEIILNYEWTSTD